MNPVRASKLPPGSLLDAYGKRGDYNDCFSVDLGRAVTLAQFIEAFYTTPVFRLERWILAVTVKRPSTDADAKSVAEGAAESFAAWRVETREANQAVFAAGRTRSWFMVDGTTLYFGSAIVKNRDGRLGPLFGGALGFHKIYSRVLLGAAARRLV